MKIRFAKLPQGRVHPLRASDVGLLEKVIPTHVFERIGIIHFADNQHTTQEAALRYFKSRFNIAVNFCLHGMTSRMLAENKSYLSLIETFGGRPDRGARRVEWDLRSAKLYSLFLIAHELAHVLYMEANLNVSKRRGSSLEENWCDEYARDAILRLRDSIVS